jgi:hypothetical protein
VQHSYRGAIYLCFIQDLVSSSDTEQVDSSGDSDLHLGSTQVKFWWETSYPVVLHGSPQSLNKIGERHYLKN